MKIVDLISIVAFSLLWILFLQKRDDVRAFLLEHGSETFWMTTPIVVFILVTVLTRIIKKKYL